MDLLFLKERVLCRISQGKEWKSMFLRTLCVIQSRRVYEAVIEEISKDALKVCEVLEILKEVEEAVRNMPAYAKERAKRKFRVEKIVEYLFSKPISLSVHKPAICSLMEMMACKVEKIEMPEDITHLEVLKRAAKESGEKATEKRVTLKIIDYLVYNKEPAKQKYLEDILEVIDRYILDNAFIEEIREKLNKNIKNWPYQENNSGQKLLNMVISEKICSSSYLVGRGFSLHKYSPFLLTEVDEVSLFFPIICAIQEESNEKEEPFTKCRVCSSLLNAEYKRYYRMHRLRIDVEIRKILKDSIFLKKNIEFIVYAVEHLEEFRNLLTLKHIVDTLKKTEKKPLEDQEKRKVFRCLKHFKIEKEEEEYLISLSKKYCEEEHPSRVLLILNILYHVKSTSQLAFASALLTEHMHRIYDSSFSRTVTRALIKKHMFFLNKEKRLIFHHFLSRIPQINRALTHLSYIYAEGSLDTLLEKEKFYLSPCLWTLNKHDSFYKDSPENSVLYAIYLLEKETHHMKEEKRKEIGDSLVQAGTDTLSIFYLAVDNPESLLKYYFLDSSSLIKRHSLMSLLFSIRRVLEETVPKKRCLFLLLKRILEVLFERSPPTKREVEKILIFLTYTGNMNGSPFCKEDSTSCSKEAFWEIFLSKLKENLFHFKYGVALELSQEKRKLLSSAKEEDILLEQSASLSQVLKRILPFLTYSSFISSIAIRKVLNILLSTTEEEIQDAVKNNWISLRVLLVRMVSLYVETRDTSISEALSLFGALSVDAIEEESISLRSTKTFIFFMEDADRKDISYFFIFHILIPIYKDTFDDLILYIIQEILKKESVPTEEEVTLFIEKLRVSKYTLESKGNPKPPPNRIYRRGMKYRTFLRNSLSLLSEIQRKEPSKLSFLKDVHLIVEALEDKKWPLNHIEKLEEFYLHLLIFSLSPKRIQEVRMIFLPVLEEIKEHSLIDKRIVRVILNSSLAYSHVFSYEELLLCGNALNDMSYLALLMERRLKKHPEERDKSLTDLQEKYLALQEKEMVLGINASIHYLSPKNLAAEYSINNEQSSLLYVEEKILKKKREKQKMPQDSILFPRKNTFASNIEEAIEEANSSIKQWIGCIPTETLCESKKTLKQLLLNLHLLKDCKILKEEAFPVALQKIKTRREAVKSEEAIFLAEAQEDLLRLLPSSQASKEAEKETLLERVRRARKAGKHEVAEKLSIHSIIQNDWRVFYERAQIYLVKDQKREAKQALKRAIKHLPTSSEYYNKAVLLRTEVEESEEIYKKAISQLKTNERVFFNYGKYLEQRNPQAALRMFCLSLQFGREKSQEIIPKMIYYLTDTEKGSQLEEKINEIIPEIQKSLESMDISLFRGYYMQIITRLHHRKSQIEKILSFLVLKLLELFPGETLWKSLSITKNTRFQNKANALLSLISQASLRVKRSFGAIRAAAELLTKIGSLEVSPGELLLSSTSMVQLPIISTMEIYSPYGSFSSYVISIEDKISVFKTLQRPKRIKMLISTGEYKYFICKAKDDLRKDARFMDLNILLNSLFLSSPSHRGFSIREYTVIPFTATAGIIEYVEKTSSLKEICMELYEKKGISFSCVLKSLVGPKKQLNERLEEILKNMPPVFSLFFERRFPHPIMWMQARKRYTITYAVMNAVGYVMGLGDRHGENILFDKETGETMHVDLNSIFEEAKHLPIPENVPFRLTQNIIDGFGPTKEDGPYRIFLEKALRFLADRKSLIVANLQGFVHDPVGEWRGRNNAQKAAEVIEKIEKKLDFDDEVGKADSLIEESTSLKNLSEIYIGWLPFL
ncbi:serine/threonine-protein kinase ATR [Nematocida sp. LUAm3]|nr:serine/threonine-protein kinase ATR [Nematocida sp. LUAm3]